MTLKADFWSNFLVLRSRFPLGQVNGQVKENTLGGAKLARCRGSVVSSGTSGFSSVYTLE